MCTINVNVVRGRSYEKFSTRKLVIQKFHNTKISRSTIFLETPILTDSHSFLMHVLL